MIAECKNATSTTLESFNWRKMKLFQAIYRPLDVFCYERMEKGLQTMLVTHSFCAGACWYGASPGAVPATGTARGCAAHPRQRKDKGQRA